MNKWKYIGMLDWQLKHSKTIDFTLAELELIVVSGLDMFPFFKKLKEVIIERDETIRYKSQATEEAISLIRIRGSELLQLFQDEYESSKGRPYDYMTDFPQIVEGRHFIQNRDLILTACIIFKKSYMTIKEIADVMDLYRKFTMKV